MDSSAFNHMPGGAFVRGIFIAALIIAVGFFGLGFLAGWWLA